MNNIIYKSKRILDGLEYGFFDTGKDWSYENFDHYYLYFNNSEYEVRKYALLVFTAGIGNWYHKSAFIFIPPSDEIKRDPLFDPSKVYYFPDYVEGFLKHREKIEEEFPEMYRMMVLYLIELDNRLYLQTIFPAVDGKLFKNLRKVLERSGFGQKFQYGDFQKFLYDLDLPSFYKT